ncbi:Flp family type IVb pilin [Vibrio panuliri]|uniref:Fimbrial protein n=1 Tax=Vibrio panuliri TaxID=1381081 RepID=A0A1Q9HCQ6_9VIBR|nr:hypothetical protein [Vibrio panuliri]KAB1455228.1 hypothetical protein F7O85_20565 [Vibrio panuliri]OLQ87150.1 hypothetical protein BIY22_11315 [Vibrio panuliri]OLQ90930.1 hypothetical protein BIY20_10230 [Vibrio panuliri]
MKAIRHEIQKFIEDEEGLTLLEYILGAALIVAALLSIDFWGTLADKFEDVADEIDGIEADGGDGGDGGGV